MALSTWTGLASAVFWLASAAISGRSGTSLSVRYVGSVRMANLQQLLRAQFWVAWLSSLAAVCAGASVAAQAIQH